MRDDSAARYPPALLFTPFSPSYSPYTPVGSSAEIEEDRHFFRSRYSLLNRKVTLECLCSLPTVRRGLFPEPSAPVGTECLIQAEQAWSRKATCGGFSISFSFLLPPGRRRGEDEAVRCRFICAGEKDSLCRPSPVYALAFFEREGTACGISLRELSSA